MLASFLARVRICTACSTKWRGQPWGRQMLHLRCCRYRAPDTCLCCSYH